MQGIQDACDDPRYRMVIVVGPERSGKSIGGENLLFKRLKFGPLTDTIIYAQAGSDVDSYADKEFADIFSLHHEDIGRHVDPLPKNNKRKFKLVKGRRIQLFAANDSNLRQREAPLIIATEIDGLRKPLAAKVIQEIRGRQKSFGNQAKAYIESHPDLGWEAGISPGWKEGTRAMMFWECPSCKLWSTPHQLAPKGMLCDFQYDRDDDLEENDNLDRAASSALLRCPHSGCLIDDEQRYEMIDGAVWVHDGQHITPEGEISGEVRNSETASFWLHGLNVKRPLGPMAREDLSATLHFERTRKPERVRRYHVKTLGEVYEGAGEGSNVIDPNRLQQRAAEQEMITTFARGEVPAWCLFVVGAVDIGARKFDAAWFGFDMEGRTALLDRITIRDRIMPDGSRRDIRPPESIEDWMQLQQAVLQRTFPIQGNEGWALPVACAAFDTGGASAKDIAGLEVGTTWKAREFARRMMKTGEYWGANKWPKVKLIKGDGGPKATEVGLGRDINRDEYGRPVTPVVREHTLQVDKLKALIMERLAVDNGGPGQVYFADDLPRSVYEELCAETRVDGVWERRGANETLDLSVYAESCRIMCDVDRQDVATALMREDPQMRPPWARPVSIEQINDENDHQADAKSSAPAAMSIYQRFDQRNAGKKR